MAIVKDRARADRLRKLFPEVEAWPDDRVNEYCQNTLIVAASDFRYAVGRFAAEIKKAFSR